MANITCSNFLISSKDEYDSPINTCKIGLRTVFQYELIGLGAANIVVTKEFENRTGRMFFRAEGYYVDELTGWENDINIRQEIDTSIIDGVSWNVANGLFTLILFERENPIPEVQFDATLVVT